MKSTAILLVWVLLSCLAEPDLRGQDNQSSEIEHREPKSRVYKRIGETELRLFIYNQENSNRSKLKPAIVFFFGGGWRSGNPRQFDHHCRYLATRGMIAVTADYRVTSRHNSTILDSVADAKSAIRWLRLQAEELGIAPDRIVAAGGSAGGHLAASSGVIPGFGEGTEDLTVSSKPNALVLFNPAVALADVQGYPPLDEAKLSTLPARAGITPKNLSPIHYIHSETPPTIIFHGQSDTTVPFWTVQAFQNKQLVAGGHSLLIGFPGKPHGFFNFGRFENRPFRQTLKGTDEFLQSLGFIEGNEEVDQYLARLADSER